MNNLESDNAALIADTPPLDSADTFGNPYEHAIRRLLTDFNAMSRECDAISTGHVDDASRHAAEGNIVRAREDLDFAVAVGHQSTAWYRAGQRIEEEIDRLHNARLAAERGEE